MSLLERDLSAASEFMARGHRDIDWANRWRRLADKYIVQSDQCAESGRKALEQAHSDPAQLDRAEMLGKESRRIVAIAARALRRAEVADARAQSLLDLVSDETPAVAH